VYEYMSFDLNGKSIFSRQGGMDCSRLNDLADQGWRLHSTIGTSGSYMVAIMERVRPEQPGKEKK
jgi:hypothetical protein